MSKRVVALIQFLAFVILVPRLVAGQFDLINVGHVNSGGYANDIKIAGSHLFLANSSDGLRIYDISNPSQPSSIGHVDTSLLASNSALANGLAVSGNLAFVANDYDGLRIYDVSIPSSPSLIGWISAGATADAWAVDVSGNYAYVATGEDGLRVFDLSNAANPSLAAHITHYDAITNVFAYASDVTVSRTNLLLANGQDGFRVYDISSPSAPSNTARIATLPGPAWGSATSGHYAYLAIGGDLFQTYDISNSVSPVLVDEDFSGGVGLSVHVAGSFAYVAGAYSGVRMYDISSRNNPLLVSSINPEASARALAVAGNHLYLANGIDGLRVYLAMPVLNVATAASNAVIVSWATPLAPGFVLQESEGLSTTKWNDVTNSPIQLNGRSSVVLPRLAASSFYRLAYH